MITIQSIQIGRIRTEGDPSTGDAVRRQWTTGFYKTPVIGTVVVGPLGIEGDQVADTRFHGGPDKAILCYAASHYALWTVEFPELEMSGGSLGENLTLEGVDESGVCIGDQYRAGSCKFQVSQPRQPCWKISRRWQMKTLTKQVAQTGRTGWYLRVMQNGELTPGDRLDLMDRPHPTWTVARANDVLFGRDVDRMSVMELMALSELAEAWKKDIA